MVQLKNGKELKIKRENIELVDGSIKGGFLSQVLRPGARFACRERGGEKGAGVGVGGGSLSMLPHRTN
jgi:hypothetical protein